MATFIHLLAENDKDAAMAEAVQAESVGKLDPRVFEVAPESFEQVPGAPFAYWVSEGVRGLFKELPPFEGDGRTVKQGLATADDFRFVRLAWEAGERKINIKRWWTFAKGGAYSPYYADVHLLVNWEIGGAEIKNNLNERWQVRSNVWMLKDTENSFFFRPGLTWPRRTNGLSFRVMPAGCIFADKGPAAFVRNDNPQELLALLAVINSAPFKKLVEVQLARTELAQSLSIRSRRAGSSWAPTT